MKDKQMIVSIYKNMYYYYLTRVGQKSEITGELITPKMIVNIIQRILEFNLLIYGEGMRPSCVPRLTEKIIGIQKEEK